MLRRLSLAGLLSAGLISPVCADMVDDVGTLEAILDSVCGQRFEVVWVDQDHKIPPCMMSYSPYCEEIQTNGPESCPLVMGTDVDADGSSTDSPDLLAAAPQQL
ncbi:hypothetical protein [Silvimonas amylolytica]|uniref:Uncharacterized protein n=1 Tax=Silvimonas amylolytica TaxID=449663 RepID=A0ABQ2PGG1_9NEIS|nr:hypothetical protein [Silvimonas amylolytica]GGP24370.1 hypothetical protein GCM10010971_01890 [Silvimonas amylolytica]